MLGRGYTIVVLLGCAGCAEATSVVDGINDQFARGVYTDDIAKAGLLLHQWDFEDPNTRWRPCHWNESAPAFRCVKNFSDIGDRTSCSLANANVSIQDGIVQLFSYPPGKWQPSNTTPGGVIVSPSHAHVRCAWSSDSGSMDRRESGCGCHETTAGNVTPAACNASCASAWVQEHGGQCSWGPREISSMLAQMYQFHFVYNEVIVDPQAWIANLPDTIVAFWYAHNHPARPCDASCVNNTVHAYTGFIETYPEAKGRVPLLALDVHGGPRPFSDVTPGDDVV